VHLAQRERVVFVGLTATGALVAAATAAELTNYAFRLDVDALDASGDGGAFGAVGVVALWCAALAAWLVVGRVRPAGRVSVALATLLTFLALDKALRLHDSIAHWPAYYVPILCATAVCLLTVARRLPAPAPRLMGWAAALLAFSLLVHFGGETALERLGASGEGLPYHLKAVIKHGSELAGWLTVTLSLAVGVLAAADRETTSAVHVSRRRFRRRMSPHGQPFVSG
jgi:hypothetical protein